ncbi:MAG: hypothetical protein OEY21_08815 [Nitrospira sp.]|nr:hypothetical protein [Nitrospira sp.]
MQVWKSSRNIGVWAVAVSLAAGSALCGVGTALAEDTTTTGNRVFFRGGAAGMTSDRAGELVSGVGNDGKFGYNIGGGAELMITRDLWGMAKSIAVVGEIGLEFKRWSSSAAPGLANLGGPAKVQMTMLTASVAPKVKFMQGTDFQPWVIPAGLDFHVISPTSSQINYLDIGVQFGGGAEYRVWKELWLGIDSRFHVASNQTNTVNNFWTTGIYGAIGF